MLKKYTICLVLAILLAIMTLTGAASASIKQLFIPGKVIRAHAKYENHCSNCHKNFKKSSQRRLCLNCHKKINADINNIQGFHGRNKDAQVTECKHCHTEHKGRKFDIIRLDEDMFNHQDTDFVLEHSHIKTACSNCHPPEKKDRDTPKKCIQCHKKDDIHKGRLTDECKRCHTPLKWSKAHFNHDKTKFPLTDKHKKVDCKLCHPKSSYKNTPYTCYGCHKLNDIHGGKYGNKCDSCHNAKKWKKSTFNHKKINAIAGIKISDCYFCHQQNDAHQKHYGKKCGNCHNAKKWKPSIFDHNKTKFPLKGKHKEISCDLCHTKDMYKEKLKINCYTCHNSSDEHKGRYSDKCEKCHTPKKWKPSTFNHDKTKFPLIDKHKKVTCNACHKGRIYQEKLGISCYNCHKYNDTHKQRFGRLCQPCHTVKGWKKSIFNHDKTVFPGGNVDNMNDCGKCYKERLSQTCYGCHKADDVHQLKEGKSCEYCHNPTGWRKNVFFDHDITNFPLTGMHTAVSCEECHLKAAYKGTDRKCINCHKTNDVHKLSLGTKCGFCHNPNGWKLWQFDHNIQSKFILDGAHLGLECKSCHNEPIKNDSARLSKNCYECHRQDSIHNGSFWKHCNRCHNTDSFKDLFIN